MTKKDKIKSISQLKPEEIKKKLDEILPVLQDAAVGDFSKKIPIANQEDEFAELSVALNLMLDDLHILVEEKNKINANLEKEIANQSKELLTSKEVFKKVFDLSPEAIIILDNKGKVININSRVSDWLGYGINEVKGNNIIKLPFLTKKSVILAGKNLAQRLAGKKLPPYELEFKMKKGGIKIGRVVGSLLKEDNKVLGDMVMITDITKEKKKVVKITESDERFRSLFNNMQDGVAIYEPINGGKNFVVKNINQAGQKISHVTLKKVQGQKVTEAFPGIKEMGLFKVLQQVYKTGQPIIHPTTSYHDNKLVGWFENDVFKLKSGEVVAVFQDLTLQVKVQNDLAKNEERLEYALRATNDGLWDWDIVSNKVYYSPRWKEIIGYKDNEIKNDFKEFETRLNPEDRDWVMKYVNNYIKSNGQGKFQIEFRMINKEGHNVHIFARAFLVKGLSGRPVRLVGTHLDITERVHEEQRYKQLLENMRLGMALYESREDGKKFYFKEFNKTAESIEGIKRSQVIGKEVREVFPGAISLGIIKLLQKVYRTGQPEYLSEGRYTDEKGNVSYRENYTYKLPTGEIVSLYNDVTDQVLAKQALRESEDRYRSLFESSRDAIMTLEPPSWKFTSANPATLEMFNVKDEKEFVKLGPWNLSPAQQPDGSSSNTEAKKSIQKAMKKGSNYFEWTHKKLRGESFPATVLLTKIKVNNKIFLQATVRNISQRKKAEKALQEKLVEMERLNKLMVGREMKMIELKKRIKELERNK